MREYDKMSKVNSTIAHEQPDDYWEVIVDELGLDSGLIAVLKNGILIKEFDSAEEARIFYLQKSGNIL